MNAGISDAQRDLQGVQLCSRPVLPVQRGLAIHHHNPPPTASTVTSTTAATPQDATWHQRSTFDGLLLRHGHGSSSFNRPGVQRIMSPRVIVRAASHAVC